jgi:hypothetical protein
MPYDDSNFFYIMAACFVAFAIAGGAAVSLKLLSQRAVDWCMGLAYIGTWLYVVMIVGSLPSSDPSLLASLVGLIMVFGALIMMWPVALAFVVIAILTKLAYKRAMAGADSPSDSTRSTFAAC